MMVLSGYGRSKASERVFSQVELPATKPRVPAKFRLTPTNRRTSTSPRTECIS
ncbi:hypothetical protein Hdeb2414_s0002g00079031 [Helianthus debilis subsp. tardiflorus]